MVVQVELPSVIAAVTVEMGGAGGIVTELGGATSVATGATEEEASAAPWAMAAALKPSKELAEPAAPQLTAKTMPW